MKPTMKKIAVGNMGEEELERLQRTVLTRDDTRAEADLLFGAPAKDMRNTDRKLLGKLFVQAPAAVTMAPNLQKNASASPFSFMKMAYEIKPADRPSIPKKDFAQPGKEEAGHKGKYPIPDRQHAKSALGFAKMHGDSAAYAAVRAKIKSKFPDMLSDEKEKESSITPHLDAFLEKLSAPTDAQRRYPELMKVSEVGTRKVPNLKPRVTTEANGPTPVRADISGGSA